MTQKKILIVTIIVSAILTISVLSLSLLPQDHDGRSWPINAIWYYTAEPSYSSDKTTEFGGTLRIEVVDDKIANLTYQITSKAVTDPSVIPKEQTSWERLMQKPRDPPVPYTDFWYKMKAMEKLPIVQGMKSDGDPYYLDEADTMLVMGFYDSSYDFLSWEYYILVREDGMILKASLTNMTPEGKTMIFNKDL